MSAVPKITAVMPAYNAVHTIGESLESILNQTVPVHELIVVDDGSRDSTVDFVTRNFPTVRVVQQANAGPGAARNHGIRLAESNWIALLDADDKWLPNKLERQLPELADDVALVHTHTVGDINKNSSELNFEQLWDHNYIGTSTVVLNKAIFNEAGGFPEGREFIGVEDYNLWLRMAMKGSRIVTIHEELTLYTPADGNLSGQIPRVVLAELLNVENLERQQIVTKKKADIKRVAILDEYARALFWMRDLKLARKYYGELLGYHFSVRSLGYWLATYLPVRLLDLKRRSTVSKNEALMQAATAGVSR